MNGIVPADPKVAYDVREVITRRCGQSGFSGDPARVCAEHRHRLRTLAGPAGRNRGQSAERHGRRAGHRRVRQGGALCPLLQCLQYSAGHVCRRARISSRRRAGARRHYPPRRQDALCILRGHRSQDHGGAAQGLWWRVHRDVLAKIWARTGFWPGRRPKIAVMGAEGAAEIVFRRRSTLPRTRGVAAERWSMSIARPFPNPYVAAGRRLVDDVIEPAETRKRLAQALESLHAKREMRPQKKHGLIPL